MFGLLNRFSYAQAIKLGGQLILYDKIMQLDGTTAGSGSQAGKLINVVANDLELFEFIPYALNAFAVPVHVVAIGIVLYFYLGPIGPICSVILFILMGLSVLLSKIPKRMREKIGAISDSRVKLLTNIIEGIRIVKLYGWDDGMQTLMDNYRKNEMKKQAVKFISRSLSLTFMTAGLGIVVMVLILFNL